MPQAGLLATQRIRNLEKLRSSLETLLQQMLARLDEMTGYIAGDESSRAEANTRREAFTEQIADEMQALGAGIAEISSGHLSQRLHQRVCV